MFNFLKKIFKPTIRKPISKMSNYSELNQEELHEKFSEFDFTWLKGDNAGDTERYSRITESGGVKFIVFQSGNRMNVDLLDDYMTTFPKAHGSLDMNAIPSTVPVQQTSRSIPPTTNVQTSVESISYNDNSFNKNQDSPIFKLLEKQKKNMVDVNIKLKINLPSKELYNVLIESFEGAEDEVIEYIINGIEIDQIKKSLSDSIKKNYYNKPETVKKVQTLKSKEAELEQ